MRTITIFLVMATICGWTATDSHSQVVTNGAIELFFDSNYTECTATVDSSSVATMYVVARLEQMSANGIAGCEFRVDPFPAGWIVGGPQYAPGVSTALGNPFGDGVTLSFVGCSFDSSGVVPLFSVVVLATTTTPEHRMRVRVKNPPSNPTTFYPLFNLCNAPLFSAVEAEASQAIINPGPGSTCDLPTAGGAPAPALSPVPTEINPPTQPAFSSAKETTWTQVKTRYKSKEKERED